MRGPARAITLVATVTIVAAAAWWVIGRGAGVPSPADRPNLVLVTIDTLRADRVGAGLTPALDALFGQGVVFSHARAAAPLTLPSHVTLMTGALPPAHGVHENGVYRFDGRQPTLASELRAAGYRTAAFVSAYVLDRRFGLDHGFERYDDGIRRDPNAADRLEAERRGETTVAAALEWLAAQRVTAAATAPPQPPFFLWVHLYDPHAPYAAPMEFLARTKASGYDAEVAYASAQVDRLVQAVATDLSAGRTIVAVTGDHGESLGEHGEATHGMLVYEAALRVPLAIVAPGRVPAARRDEPVSLADVAPTLLALAGRPIPASMRGIDLLRAQRPAPPPTYAESEYPRTAGWSSVHALADRRWKLILSTSPELYDLSADPGEQRNVAADHGEVVRSMSATLDGLRAAPDGPAAAAPISAEAARQLRSLGYVAVAPGESGPRAGGPNPAAHMAAWTAFEAALGDLAGGAAGRAMPTLERLARDYPDARVFLTTHARARLDAGDAAGALEWYRKAVRRWPTDATLLHDLAVAAREAGARAEAMTAERAAIALEPDHAAALNGLGLLHVETGAWRDAAAAFTRATAIDATNPSYWTNLGNVQRELGDGAGAEASYQRAWTLDPHYADAANGLGVLRVQTGRPAEAVAWFERALAQTPELHEARLNLAVAYAQSGQRDQAIAALREILRAPPRFQRERQAAAELLAQLTRR